MVATQTPNSVVASFQKRRLVRRYAALQQELEWRRCRHDFIYFWTNYWYILHPTYGATKQELYPEMEDMADFLDKNLHSCILKGRQIGMSTFITAYVFWKLFFCNEPRTALFLSIKQDAAVKMLQKVTFGYSRLPAWMKKRGPQRTNRHTQEFHLSNGSSIESLASKKNAARSLTAWIVVLDEWAFYDDPEDAWSSVEPTVSIGAAEFPKFKANPGDCGGRIVALSTANRSNDFFHNFWNDAVSGKNGFKARFLSAMIPPSRDEAWYEGQKKKLPEWQLHREYPIDAALAFMKSGNPIFDTEKLQKLKTQPYVLCRLVDSLGGDTFLAPSESGLIRWFGDVPTEKYFKLEGSELRHNYVISADTSKGVDGGDYSSADVVRLPYFDTDGAFVPAEQVAHYYGHVDPDEFGIDLARMGKFWNNALIVPESNNHGNTTIYTLTRVAGYRRVYRRQVKRNKRDKITKELGFYTSTATKPPLIDGLKAYIRDDSITINSEVSRVECMNYVRTKNGKMEGVPHDDCVMSLALAVEGIGSRVDDFRSADPTDPRSRWSFNTLWSELKIEQMNERAKGYVVG